MQHSFNDSQIRVLKPFGFVFIVVVIIVLLVVTISQLSTLAKSVSALQNYLTIKDRDFSAATGESSAEEIAITDATNSSTIGKIINDASDCPFTYTKLSMDSEKAFGDTLFIVQFFPNELKSQAVGSCLYMRQNNVYSVIAGSPNWKGYSVVAFVQDRYVLATQGCGTECNSTYLIDITNKASHVLASSPYNIVTADKRWFISCDRQLYAQYGDDSQIVQTNMCRAFNLMTFETLLFAPSIYDPYSKDEIVKTNLENYWYDVDQENLIVKGNELTVKFVDKRNNTKYSRIFLIDKEFVEKK